MSCGVSSLIACKLANCDIVNYIHVANQHPDTLRFLADARAFLGMPINVLQSYRYLTVDEVISRRQYINGAAGAACTLELKKRVRQDWERSNFGRHTYVWGYDINELSRADRIVETLVEFEHEFPLIDRNLTKEDCHAMCEDAGIKRPVMYDLGYPNNNCIGCVKGGMGYWNKIREDFPEVFERRAQQEREIGHSCIKGVFLDELEPWRGRNNPVVPSCSIDCELAKQSEDRREEGHGRLGIPHEGCKRSEESVGDSD